MNKSKISLLIEKFKQSRDESQKILNKVHKGLDSSSDLYLLGSIDAYNDVIAELNRLLQEEGENDRNGE